MNLKECFKRAGIRKLHSFQKIVVEFFGNDDDYDLVLNAPTGTGKTISFVIALSNRIKSLKCDSVFALVLVPTQAIVQQINNLFRKILSKKPHSLVCDTPESFFSKENYKNILDSIKYLIVDEADRFVSDGFNDYLNILSESKNINFRIPSLWNIRCRRLLSSATLNSESFYIEKFGLINFKLANSKMKTNITEFYIKSKIEDKSSVILNLLFNETYQKILIFVNSLSSLTQLYDSLNNYSSDNQKTSVLRYHSHLFDQEKKRTIQEFENKNKRALLISTDAISRGVDLKMCDLVVNFELPRTRSCYIHRIGRTGRGLMRGTALSLITNEREAKLIEIDKLEEFEM